MNRIINPTSGLLFMKVGLHAGETFGQILERKRQEYQITEKIFWGYGGGTCHPTKVIQPFARMTIEEGKSIYIVMEEIDSHHPPTNIMASEYSEDGIEWKPIPAGINVRGSRYAVILDDIQEGELDLDLSEYKVAVGPSTGRIASKYISGRVDKACITKLEQRPSGLDSQIKKINHIAKIKAPFAVFTR